MSFHAFSGSIFGGSHSKSNHQDKVGIVSFNSFSLMESLKKKQGNKFPAKPLAKLVLKD